MWLIHGKNNRIDLTFCRIRDKPAAQVLSAAPMRRKLVSQRAGNWEMRLARRKTRVRFGLAIGRETVARFALRLARPPQESGLHYRCPFNADIGIGSVSTLFTVVNTLFFKPLSVDRSSDVVFVSATRRHGMMRGAPVSYPDYLHFRKSADTLAELAAHYSTAPLFVTVANRSKELNGAVVSGNFFDVLRSKPEFGRFFGTDEDSLPDRDRVAVVSHNFWKNWLGSSRGALGSAIRINGVRFAVIGVVPQTLPSLADSATEIYIPTMMLRIGYRFCYDSLGSD